MLKQNETMGFKLFYFQDIRCSVLSKYLQTKVLDPYPHSNSRQQLGTLEACPFHLLHISTSLDRQLQNGTDRGTPTFNVRLFSKGKNKKDFHQEMKLDEAWNNQIFFFFGCCNTDQIFQLKLKLSWGKVEGVRGKKRLSQQVNKCGIFLNSNYFQH